MRRKIGLRTLLSLLLGGLVLATSFVTLGILVTASSDAAFDDAIDKGRQAQAVLSERMNAEFAKIERVASILAAENGLIADEGRRRDIVALSDIADRVIVNPGPQVGWFKYRNTLAFRPSDTSVPVSIDLKAVSSLMSGILQEGVAGVVLLGDQVLARTRSDGRIDEASDAKLETLFKTPIVPDEVLDAAPTLQRVIRDDDEPVFISSSIIDLNGGSVAAGNARAILRVGFATTPSTVGRSIAQIGIASVVAFGFVILAVLFAFSLARRISRRITQVRDQLGRIAGLDLDAPDDIREMPARELEDIRLALATAIQSLRTFSLFVPKQLVLRLLAHGDGSLRLAETRNVTVLFTDIVGFTKLASTMDPADVTAMLNAHFAVVTDIIEAEGGIIDKFMGDGILAFWGAPEVTSDHAARGLRAASAILAAHQADKATFGLRLGVHSGPVIAGTVGTATRLNYTVMGDTVNVASRLEQLGREVDPDGHCCALVSAHTLAEAPTDDCEPIGAHVLRGRDEPLEVYRLRAGSF